MTISDTDRIDIIATRPGSPAVRLVIADHLDWDHVNDHVLQLQEKINTDPAFIESGQLRQRPGVALSNDVAADKRAIVRRGCAASLFHSLVS